MLLLAGSLQVGDKRVRLISKPGLDSIAAIENLRIGKAGSTEQLSNSLCGDGKSARSRSPLATYSF
ncbi:hypothetical protein [Alishewanella longhuensis]